MFLEKIQTNQLEAKRELEIQNENTVGKTLHPRPFKQNSKQQGLQLLDSSHTLLKSMAVCSFYTNHIMQTGSKFHTFKEYLSSQ